MDTNSQRQKRQGNTLSLLNVTIEAMNLAKEVSSATPAKAIFGSVSVLLTMIRDSMANRSDYVDLGLACADVCRALERGMNGKKLEDLSQSVCEAVNQLTTTVAEIQRKVIKQNGRNVVSRIFQAGNDKNTIAAWNADLNRILQVFNTELIMNTHVTVSDIRDDVSGIRRGMSMIQEEIGGQVFLARTRLEEASSLGESPPPPPRACFGRDELIEKIVSLAEGFTPIALIGPGGIGKTSIALTVLHHDRIKGRFGENRWFIRCDLFPPSRVHFLGRLSEVIGAGIENPEDLTPLRPFLSSRGMIIVLDNAESILDPRGTNAREIYATVEELSQFSNIYLFLTSRISTIPPACESLDIPTLSMGAACDTFYCIYKSSERSDPVNNILEQLDFHPLSISLLATVAQHNKWDISRLAREWDEQRTSVLHTQHDNSLAATIELSLASPMFRKLSPDARGLLEVIAFFPQGVDENNLEWLFPTTPDRKVIFDNFCILSLTYRSNGFVTMLAPLRDYLCPKDPVSSPLLCATKERYFYRLSVAVNPGEPGFEEAQWVRSEDANIEYLLDVFTSVDANSGDAWDVCAHFMEHLYWHKRRPVILGPKIERLPDGHLSKPICLFELSRLFDSIGNPGESKRLLIPALKLWRERGNHFQVAQALRYLAQANRLLGLYKEGIGQVKEALEIDERFNQVSGQADSWQRLARLLYADEQLDAAEEAAFRAINLLDQGEQFTVCKCHCLLGLIYHSKGETEKAINHLETAGGIASTFNWHSLLFWSNYSLAELFFGENRFDDAHAHVRLAKSHAINFPYYLGRAMELQAGFWYKERRFEEAKSGFLHAADVYEGIGATKYVEGCRAILQDIEETVNDPAASHELDSSAQGHLYHPPDLFDAPANQFGSAPRPISHS